MSEWQGINLGTFRNEMAGRLRCVECGKLGSLYAQGWQAHEPDGHDTDDPAALVFFCPTCAERNFG